MPRPRPGAPGVFAIRRLVLIASLALLAGCANDHAAQKELTGMRAEVRAMREELAQLSRRTQRLEEDLIVQRSARRERASEGEQPWNGTTVPGLTVVKVTPRTRAAPPLPVKAFVQEPSAEEFEALLAGDAELGEDPASADPGAADLAFDQAMAKLKTGNISGAVLQLQKFAQENPRHARSDNALYFSGVGLMALEDYPGAATAFQRVLDEYPAGNARMEALLELADCRMKQHQPEDARALYARLISTYPGTAAASRAQQRLSSFTQ